MLRYFQFANIAVNISNPFGLSSHVLRVFLQSGTLSTKKFFAKHHGHCANHASLESSYCILASIGYIDEPIYWSGLQTHLSNSRCVSIKLICATYFSGFIQWHFLSNIQ